MYELNRLRVQQFLGLRRADITFAKPITLFLGLNAQAKSSVRDALDFAFTGQARHVSKVKDVPLLAHEGDEKEMQVLLNLTDDSGPFELRRTKMNARTGVDIFPAMLRYCIKPMMFLDLEPRQRGALLSEALGGGQDELVEEAINKHVGKIHVKLAGELKRSGVDMHDVEAFKAKIVEQRRIYKRVKPDTAEPKITDYDLPEDFDAAKTETELRAAQERLANLRVARKAVERLKSNKKELKDLESQIKRNEAAEAPTQKDLNALALLNEMVQLQDMVSRSVRSGNCCVCTSCHKYEDWEKLAAKYAAAASDYKKMAHTAESKKLTYDEAQSALPGQRAIRDRIRKEIDEDAKLAGKIDEDAISELGVQTEKMSKQLQNYSRYTLALEQHDEDMKEAKDNDILIEECNRIDRALADGGPVKAEIASGGKQLPLNEELLTAWGLESLEIQDNGDILVFGRPVESASDSERYRVASVLGIALAELCEVGFACLDSYEVLVGEPANALLSVYQGGGINNVLIFASRNKTQLYQINAKTLPEYVEAYLVSNGEVAALK